MKDLHLEDVSGLGDVIIESSSLESISTRVRIAEFIFQVIDLRKYASDGLIVATKCSLFLLHTLSIWYVIGISAETVMPYLIFFLT